MRRKGLVRKKYKFTDKSQSIGGIVSTMLAAVSIGFWVAGVMISYEHRGNGGRIIGLLGLCSVFFAAAGLYKGIKSFQEEEIFFHFSWIGSIVSAAMLVGMAMIILIGI